METNGRWSFTPQGFLLSNTLIGMLLIAFLAFLLYSLFRQVMDALLTIFNEIVFRIRQSR